MSSEILRFDKKTSPENAKPLWRREALEEKNVGTGGSDLQCLVKFLGIIIICGRPNLSILGLYGRHERER